jgi:SAM-dependent methyltransferase
VSWTSGGAYEGYVGRWSRLVAREFVGWLSAPPGLRWLDAGCGTGALAGTILDRAAPRQVTGLDMSPAYAGHAAGQVRDVRAVFGVADAQALPLAGASVDMAVSGLVLNFVPDPARMAAELARVTRAGGTVAVYVWDYAGGMQLMRRFWDAAIALDPAAAAKDEGPLFPVCRPEALAGLWTAAGLHDVEARAIDVPTVFGDFEDYWAPFLAGQGPAPAYCAGLDEARRDALRERLRATLPEQPDGSIPLVARAWAVRGRTAQR